MKIGNSLAVQWLKFGAFTAVGPGLIPARGSKIPQAARCGQNKQTKNNENIEQK